MSAAMTISFDTLEYVKKLKAADVPEKQAEAQAEALRGVLETALAEQSHVQSEATTRAVSALEAQTEKSAARLESNLEKAILRLDASIMELNAKIDLVRKEIELARKDAVIKLSSTMAAGFSITIAVLFKLLG